MKNSFFFCAIASCLLFAKSDAKIYYVAINGNDGNNGSITAPKRTVNAAIAIAAAKDTIYVRGGTYRGQTIQLNKSQLTIQAYSYEYVLFTGARQITTWTIYSSARGVYRYQWTGDPRCPEQVMCPYNVNGVIVYRPLQQIGQAGKPYHSAYNPAGTNIRYLTPVNLGTDQNSMAEGTFYCTDNNPGTAGSTKTVYIRPGAGASLSGGVELAGLRTLVSVNAGVTGCIMRGLAFAMDNSSAYTEQGAAVYMGPGFTVDNCLIERCAFIGLQLPANNAASQPGKIVNSVFRDNGCIGVGAFQSRNFTISNCLFERNKYRPFNPQWYGGGAKITGDSSYGIVEKSECLDNKAPGIWFDNCSGGQSVIRNCFLKGNDIPGSIVYEIGNSGLIENNVIADARLRGIYITTSSKCTVRHNTIHRTNVYTNGGAAISVYYEPRGTETLTGNSIINNLISDTYGAAGSVPDLIMSRGNSYIGNNTSHHNNFYRSGGSRWVMYTYPNTWTQSTTLADWQTRWQLDAGSNVRNPGYAFLPVRWDFFATRTNTMDFGASSQVPRDYVLTTRPRDAAFDAGAFEYNGEVFNGLIGFWRLDRGKGNIAYNDAGPYADGRLHATGWFPFAKVGANAMQFGGHAGSYVDCGNDKRINPPGAMTLSAWFRFRPQSNTQNFVGIDKNGSYRLVAIDVITTPGAANYRKTRWQFAIWINSTYTGVSTVKYYDNEVWQHVMGVYDTTSSKLSIYVNGVLDNAITISGTRTVGNNRLELGRTDGAGSPIEPPYTASGRGYLGEIDHVRLFNRALPPPGPGGANWYVSALTGNDSNDGRTPATPFATLRRVEKASYGPGDTIFIMNGIYGNLNTSSTGTNLMTITRSGKAGAPVMIRNYPGHSPELRFNGWSALGVYASYIEISGLKIRGPNSVKTLYSALNQPGSCNNPGGSVDPSFNGNGIHIDGRNAYNTGHVHHITVRNCQVFECGGAGLNAIEADYITFENNRVYNNAWYSIYGASGINIFHAWNYDNNTTTYRNIIQNNFSYGNEMRVPWPGGGCKFTDGNGIILDDFHNTQSSSTIQGQVYGGKTLVANNLVYRNGGRGIHLYKSSNVDIINNTVYSNNRTPEINDGEITVITNGTTRVANFKVFNNIMVANQGKKLCTVSGLVSTLKAGNNLLYGSTTYCFLGSNSKIADPKFVNAGGNDFRLTASSSAIDTGNDTAGYYTLKDILGINRPYHLRPDIGAYEYTGPLTASPTFTSAHQPLLRKADGELKLYPNPAVDRLMVSYPEAAPGSVLSVVDMNGKIIWRQVLANTSWQVQIDISRIAGGQYSVVLATLKGILFSKFIVNR